MKKTFRVESGFYFTQEEADYEVFQIGKKSYCGIEIKDNKLNRDVVKEISYHSPQGNGDAHYADIEFESGVSRRVFNLHSVYGKE